MALCNYITALAESAERRIPPETINIVAENEYTPLQDSRFLADVIDWSCGEGIEIWSAGIVDSAVGVNSLQVNNQNLHLALQGIIMGALLAISFGIAMDRNQSIFAFATNAEEDHPAFSHPDAYSRGSWEITQSVKLGEKVRLLH